MVDKLADLHAVDIAASGLASYGRADGYLARQLRRFAGLLRAHKTRPLAELDKVGRWLEATRPASGPATVVHGDYRLGNVIFNVTHPAEIAAILDWELGTIGDPLADLGYLSAMWAEPDDEDTPMLRLSRVTRLQGFWGRRDLLERYATRTGSALDDITWYEVLALWKSAIFLECSYARYLNGATTDPYFATLRDGVPALAITANSRITRAPD
jgi:aminoglycoside phosphotransferase (APT) family kinase protein